MKKRTLKYLAGLALLLLIGGTTVYFYINKGPVNIAQTSPAAAISASDLQNAFVSDSLSAFKKYVGDEKNGKVIKVTGEVTQVSNNQDSQMIVILKTAVEGETINCELEQKGADVKTGQVLALKGYCSGYISGDKDMGLPGVVNMRRCYLDK